MPELADPAKLQYLDKSFALNRRWWEQYQRASAPAPLPVAVGARKDDGARTIPVRIGDDIAAAHRDGKLATVVLRMEASGAVLGDALGVTMNDAPKEVVDCNSDDGVELALRPSSLKRGVNQLVLV